MHTLFDTHAHLDDEQFSSDSAEVIARARAAGVGQILTVGTGIASSESALALARSHSGVVAAAGIHPHEADTWDGKARERLQNLVGKPEVVAVGEIGLDFFRGEHDETLQRSVFREQLEIAGNRGLPALVHCRDAHQALYEEVKSVQCAVILHCFSGSRAWAEKCVELGAAISFAGNLTYPRSDELREVARIVPEKVLLIETDCPYLAPQGRRGCRNEPAFLPEVAAAIAKLRNLAPADVARITGRNARRVLGGGQTADSAIVYVIRDSLYINVTNRCTNECSFCVRFFQDGVGGHRLTLDHEPTGAEILRSVEAEGRYREAVFCGYGEPLLRLDVVKDVARALKQSGWYVRIDTNGLADLIHGRAVAPELSGLVDEISVSLNAPDARQYEELCRPQFGERAFGAVLAFVRSCRQAIPRVTVTAVALPGVDLRACERLAREELDVDFRVRPYVPKAREGKRVNA